MKFRKLMIAAAVALTATAHADDLVVGTVNPMSGVLADLSNDLVSGVKACFEAINAKGGVNGNRIQLVARDGGYKPGDAANVVKQVIEQEKPIAMIAIAGTSINEAILEQKLLTSHQIPLIGPLSGGAALRKPINPYLYNLRASYKVEAQRLVKQALSSGATKVAVFYQNDDFGQDGLAAAEAAMVKAGHKLAASGGYETGSDDVKAAVAAILKSQPDAVVMFSANKSTAAFIKAMRAAGSNAQFYNVSTVNHKALIQLAGLNNVQNMVISQVVPSPNNTVKSVVREYRENLKKYVPTAQPSHNGLESYIAAKVLVEGLKHAGNSPTRSSLQRALDGLGRYNAGGFEVTFGEGSDLVELGIVGPDGELRQ